jgi:hypothetical protein
MIVDRHKPPKSLSLKQASYFSYNTLHDNRASVNSDNKSSLNTQKHHFVLLDSK